MTKVYGKAGWESGAARAGTQGAGGGDPPPPPPPPPPPNNTGPFRKMLGLWGLLAAHWGNEIFLGDTSFTDSNGSNWVGASGHLADLRAVGACCIMKVTGGASSTVCNGEGTSLTYPGGNPLVDGEKGSFSPTIHKSNFHIFADDLEDAGGLNQLEDAFGEGTARAINVADDYGAPRSTPTTNGYIRPITYEQLEDICGNIKSRWVWAPCMGRVANSYHRSAAALAGASTLGAPRINGVRQFVYFDAGYHQHRASHDGDPVAYFAARVKDGLDCSLASFGGANQLRRGKGPPSTKFPNSDGWDTIIDNCANPGQFTLSPSELRRVMLAAIRNPNLMGWNPWAYTGGTGCSDQYSNDSRIKAVYAEAILEAAGLKDPPAHVHPLTAP